jgi:DNA-binding IclR family transcriptional regulator
LEELKARKYIEFEAGLQVYTIGLKAIEVGVTGLNNIEVVDVSMPHIRDLAQQSGETSFLAAYYEGEIVYLYKIEGTQSVRTTAQLGMRRPIHCTAVGKAIVSCFPREQVDQILAQKGTKNYTKNTITDPQKFHDELQRIKAQGYAVDREEIEIGLTCFAVPIFNYMGQVIGSISLGGPTSRIREKQNESIDLLKEKANLISRRMGFVPLKGGA